MIIFKDRFKLPHEVSIDNSSKLKKMKNKLFIYDR